LARLIKNIRNRNLVEFDKGFFDEWCVYLKREGMQRYAPKDTEYFSILNDLGNTFGKAKIYNDFTLFYNKTNNKIDNRILELITTLSIDYESNAEEVDIWFTVIYAGMVAEENKINAILKKRIKRLGMHKVLLENIDPETAANFSKGKKWKELDVLMKTKGF
jgi:hypothetical protein